MSIICLLSKLELPLACKQKCSLQYLAFFGPSQLVMKSKGKSRSKKFDENSVVPKLSSSTRFTLLGGNGKTNDQLVLTMWNVNGIRSVIDKKAIGQLIRTAKPDFICLNETKISEDYYKEKNIKFDGYKGYWNFCKVSAGYSGVAVFTKFIPISVLEDLEEPEYSQEGRILTLQYQLFYLVVVYMPSVGVKKPGDKVHDRLDFKTQKYEVSFQRHCQRLRETGKGVIICGDLNVCHEELDIHVTPQAHKQPGFTYEERTSFKHFLDKGWVDTFRRLNPTKRVYTWWKIEYGNREKNIGKRLDYFLVNQQFFKTVTKAQVLSEIKGSDHCPVYLSIDLGKVNPQESKGQTQNEKKEQNTEGLKPQLQEKIETIKLKEAEKKENQQNQGDQDEDRRTTEVIPSKTTDN